MPTHSTKTTTLRIQHPKYFKAFDNSDNPCCWQVDKLCVDVDAILDSRGMTYEKMPGDWGTSYSWATKGIHHAMTVSCTDDDICEFSIEFFAFKKQWAIFTKRVPNGSSDFRQILPQLRTLNAS